MLAVKFNITVDATSNVSCLTPLRDGNDDNSFHFACFGFALFTSMINLMCFYDQARELSDETSLIQKWNLLDPTIKAVYDLDKHKKSIEYNRALFRYYFVRTLLFNTPFNLYMLIKGYATMWDTISQRVEPYLCESFGASGTDLSIGLCCILAYELVKVVCMIPFSYYEVFYVDQHYGFSQANFLSFLIEKVMTFI